MKIIRRVNKKLFAGPKKFVKFVTIILPSLKLLNVSESFCPLVHAELYSGGDDSHLKLLSLFQVEAPIHAHLPAGMALETERQI